MGCQVNPHEGWWDSIITDMAVENIWRAEGSTKDWIDKILQYAYQPIKQGDNTLIVYSSRFYRRNVLRKSMTAPEWTKFLRKERQLIRRKAQKRRRGW
jgi:hypothetical protein